MSKILWLYNWVTTFFPIVWRKNDYYCQGKRMGLWYAGFIAKTVADTCLEIRRTK